MDYNVIKALHIIFVVTWFAGLFYMFRLFVYHTEAALKPEPSRSILMDQYRLMEKRLWYGITWPSAILTLIFGTWLLIVQPIWLTQPWMHLKLFFIVLLMMYQFYGQSLLKKINLQPERISSFKMRLMNEAPTVILIAVVFLVVMKEAVSWIWGILGILGIGTLLTIAVYAYKKRRAKNEKD
jgi:putative membrane protein